MVPIEEQAFELFNDFTDPENNPRLDEYLAEFDSVPRYLLLDQSADRARARLRGATFEWFCDRHLATQRPEDSIFLASDEVTDVYNRYYCNLGRYDDSGRLLSGVQNVSVPDGLLFQLGTNHWQLSTFYEYKLGFPKAADVARQITHFVVPNLIESTLELFHVRGRDRLGGYLEELRPEMPGNPVILSPKHKLFHVVPQDSYLSRKWIIGTIEPTDIPPAKLASVVGEPLRLPFTQLQFGQFFDLLARESVRTRPKKR